MQKLLSFVIPCYRSENTIRLVIDEIIETVNQQSGQYDYEIICVNDCSPDNVYDVLKSMAKENHKIKVVNLAKNMGKHAAVMAGYSLVRGDIIVNLDDDGQCPVCNLMKLIGKIDAGYDVAVAKYCKKEEPAGKILGSKLNTLMLEWLLDKPKEIVLNNFCVFSRFVVDEIRKYRNPFPYIDGLLLRVTNNIACVEMEERKRFDGEGNFTLAKSISLFLNGFTAFSVKPLHLSTILGFALSIIGFTYGIFIVIDKIIHPQGILVGYSSIMSVILFTSGCILIILGLIGEYIGRIYICINNSPQYSIKEIISNEKPDNEFRSKEG